MALRDVVAKFVIDVTGGDKLADADRKLTSAKNNARGFIGELRAMSRLWVGGQIVNGIRQFVLGQIQMADELKHNAENLGLTTDELQKYQYVAQTMQVPTQQAIVAFRFFNRAIGEVALGTKSTTKYFRQMGIQIRDGNGQIKPTDQLLLEFSDKLHAIPDQATRTAFAMRALGRGGASMLPVLQQGSAALKEMFDDVREMGGGLDEDFIQKAHDVDRQQKRLALGWRTMRTAIVRELLPALVEWVKHGIANVKILIDTAKHSYALRTALIFLGAAAATYGALAYASWLPLIALFTAIGAAIFAAYIVFDDFYTFLAGGDSVIGRQIDKLGGDSKGVAAEITGAFNAIKDAVFAATDGMKDFHKSFVGVFVDGIPQIAAWGGEFLTLVVSRVDEAINEVDRLQHAIASVTIMFDRFAHPFKGSAAVFDAAQNLVDKEFADKQAAYDQRQQNYQRMARAFDSLTTPVNKAPPPAPGAGAPGAPGNTDVPYFLAAQPQPNQPGAPNVPAMWNGSLSVTNNVTVHTTGQAAPKEITNAATAGTRKAFRAVGAGMPSATGAQ